MIAARSHGNAVIPAFNAARCAADSDSGATKVHCLDRRAGRPRRMPIPASITFIEEYSMNARQQKVLARFGQVLTFLDANASSVTPASVATQRQALESAIAQINGFAQDQVVKGTESVMAQTLSSARTSLRDTYMRQLSTVGLHKLTGKNAGDPSVPNAKQVFALPATRTNESVLAQAAQAMVTAATPYASIFTAAGVSLDAVNAAIQALQNAVAASNSAKRVSKGATQGIVAQIAAGKGAIRLMDVVIRPEIAANKALLTQWESVKRAAGGQNLASPVPAAATPPSATSPTTVQPTTTQPATTQPAATQPTTTQPASTTPAASTPPTGA
jgi:hypothetical protein